MTKSLSSTAAFAFVVAAALVTFCYGVRFSVLRPWVYEPARFTFAAIVFCRLAYVTAKAWFQSYGPSRSVAPARSVYSVPRRFGLGTLFLITLVVGILSAGLNGLNLEPAHVILVLVFVCLVGVLQFVLDQAPRHASMVAGSFFFPIAAGASMVLWDLRYVAQMPLSAIAFYSACWSVGGAAIGYATGTLVGGVFLLTDSIASAFERRKEDQHAVPGEPARLTPENGESEYEADYPYSPLRATHRSSSPRAEPF